LADLNGVDLSEADLSEANLQLSGWNVILAISFYRSFSRYLSTDNPDRAVFRRANLSKVKLSKAKLSKVDLYGADLSEADLSEADLSRAYLSRANLKGVTGITVEELEKQAKSLKGATMPDGSIHP
jgi:uncharacterized protein YjbI with pentapeptide repeats